MKGVDLIIKDFKKEDKQIRGITVFNSRTKEVIASTASKKIAEKVVKSRREYLKLGEKMRKLWGGQGGGKFNWDALSLSRYIIVGVKIKGDIYLSIEYIVEKAPSAAIEDALEIALMVNQEL